jgi:hypothetical protein
LRVGAGFKPARAPTTPLGTRRCGGHYPAAPYEETPMTITAAHFSPLIALIAGILILIMPRLLNFIVAIYLILVGLMGLNNIHHFIH